METQTFSDGLPSGPPQCVPACITNALMAAHDLGLRPVRFFLSQTFHRDMERAFHFPDFDVIGGVPTSVMPFHAGVKSPDCTDSLLLAEGPRFPLALGGLYLSFDDAEPGVLPRRPSLAASAAWPARIAKIYQAPN